MNEAQSPLVTFALFAYNQKKYIAEAVNAALRQTYTPLQIILSDDASDDGTYELMCQIVSRYDGHHEIILNRNERNLGIGAHVNKVMEMAKGEIIVAAAGDDISDTNRAETVANEFLKSEGKIYSIWSAARYIDDAGYLLVRRFPGTLEEFTEETMVRNIRPLIGATHAWRREVFDLFGPLMDGIVFEDNAISFRSYLLGDIKYLDQELVSYRSHSNNITNFTRVGDFKTLYAAAAKRNTWALIGVNQRKRDLEFAIAKKLFVNRNALSLRRELMKIELRTKLRLKCYLQFPLFKFDILLGSFRDIEILKVVIRSVQCRLMGN